MAGLTNCQRCGHGAHIATCPLCFCDDFVPARLGWVGVTELHRRHGLPNNTIHRLIARGIIRPSNGYGVDSGNAYLFDVHEQRALAAVVSFLRSHLFNGGRKVPPHPATRRACQRIAAAARDPSPAHGQRWLILLEDGTCVRGTDEDAAHAVGVRTLIEMPR